MNTNYQPQYGATSPGRRRVDVQSNGSPSIYRYGLTNPSTTTTHTVTTTRNSGGQTRATNMLQNHLYHNHQQHHISSMSDDDDENDVQFDSDHSNHQHTRYLQQQQQQQQQQKINTITTANQQQYTTEFRKNVLNESRNPRKLKESLYLSRCSTGSDDSYNNSFENTNQFNNKSYLKDKDKQQQQQQHSNQLVDNSKNNISTTITTTSSANKSATTNPKYKNIASNIFGNNVLVMVTAIIIFFAFLGFLDLSFYYIGGRFLFFSRYLNTTSITSSSTASLSPPTSISPLAIQEQLPIISSFIENSKWSSNIQNSLLDQHNLIKELTNSQNIIKQEIVGHQQLVQDLKREITSMKTTIERVSTNRDIDIDSLKTEIQSFVQQAIGELETRVGNHKDKVTEYQVQSIRSLETKYQSIVDDLDKLSTKQLSVTTQEYSKAQQHWEHHLEKLKVQLESLGKELTHSLVSNIQQEYQQEHQQANQKLNSLFLSIQNKLDRVQVFINENPGITSLSNSISSLEDLLEIYSSDKIAKPDYALYSAGASIEYNSIFKISKTYPSSTGTSLFSMPTSWFIPTPKPNPPETILDPKVITGSCWGFEGGNGTVVIKLSERIRITEVTLEHISPNIAHHINSSPKEFRVIGLKNISDHGTDLGVFTYDTSKNRHLQTFEVLNNVEEQTFSHVVLQVLSNYGYKYTCVYRFRVHGYPIPISIQNEITTTTTDDNNIDNDVSDDNSNINESEHLTQQIVETTFQEQDQQQLVE
ncbi:hypothetical protein CYY_009818 [Polysphondylium violaceum]|uniref:SUN domain-containing protein n=1 Tax=Polysphondylium violaceum TaxID=133409 RepID=A0A8J4PKJ5_9MYCE|nr:hypothetical protein CYY_009818 [Polysphondylium violaceum]